MSFFYRFFCGLCMGCADIVPGISGGTLAWIMGFYGELLGAIRSIDRSFLAQLICGKWREIVQTSSFKFLVPLVLGIGTAFILLAHWINFILADPLQRSYLYGAFFGLVLASIWICRKEVGRWKALHFFLLFTGITLSFLLTNKSLGLFSRESFKTAIVTTPDSFDIWAVFSGMLAVTALLLPGVSGSYVLNLMGMYHPALEAISSFTSQLRHFQFDGAAFLFLLNLACGILLGAVLFSRAIHWLLSHYKAPTVALLMGVMLGTLESVWPFWSYLSIEVPTKGLQLQPQVPVWPEVSSTPFLITCGCCLAGLVFVLLVHSIAAHKRMIHSL